MVVWDVNRILVRSWMSETSYRNVVVKVAGLELCSAVAAWGSRRYLSRERAVPLGLIQVAA